MDHRHNPTKLSTRSGLAARIYCDGDRVRAAQILFPHARMVRRGLKLATEGLPNPLSFGRTNKEYESPAALFSLSGSMPCVRYGSFIALGVGGCSPMPSCIQPQPRRCVTT